MAVMYSIRIRVESGRNGASRKAAIAAAMGMMGAAAGVREGRGGCTSSCSLGGEG